MEFCNGDEARKKKMIALQERQISDDMIICFDAVPALGIEIGKTILCSACVECSQAIKVIASNYMKGNQFVRTSYLQRDLIV